MSVFTFPCVDIPATLGPQAGRSWAEARWWAERVPSRGPARSPLRLSRAQCGRLFVVMRPRAGVSGMEPPKWACWVKGRYLSFWWLLPDFPSTRAMPVSNDREACFPVASLVLAWTFGFLPVLCRWPVPFVSKQTSTAFILILLLTMKDELSGTQPGLLPPGQLVSYTHALCSCRALHQEHFLLTLRVFILRGCQTPSLLRNFSWFCFAPLPQTFPPPPLSLWLNYSWLVLLPAV